MTRRQIGLLTTAAAVAVAIRCAPSLQAEPADPPPAWPASPWHGVIDGNGEPIPCRCRFAGREWRLGALVCMTTHVGTVLARCDLNLNNTSWVPTSTPCELSRAPPASPRPATAGHGPPRG